MKIGCLLFLRNIAKCIKAIELYFTQIRINNIPNIVNENDQENHNHKLHAQTHGIARKSHKTRDTRKTNEQINQLSLSLQDDCKIKMDTKQRTTGI